MPHAAMIGVAIAAYLIGSVPFAVLVSRAMGLRDPRTYGSGNPGATNVLRSGSKVAAVLTLLGDGFKGWFAVWLTRMLQAQLGLNDVGVALVALAVVVGHLYPIFLNFRGGKGVATAGGVLFAINPWLGLFAALTWVAVAALSRYSSLASLATALSAPIYAGLMRLPFAMLLALIAIAALIVYRHRANIRSLRAGTERRIGTARAPSNSN